MATKQKAPAKEGSRTFPVMLSPRDREILNRLAKMQGRTCAAAARSAIHRSFYIELAEQERRQQIAFVDENGKPTIIHFVM